MSPNFRAFLEATLHPHWHPSLIGSRSDDPEPDPSTTKCRVVDHTQDFRRLFKKTAPQEIRNTPEDQNPDSAPS